MEPCCRCVAAPDQVETWGVVVGNPDASLPAEPDVLVIEVETLELVELHRAGRLWHASGQDSEPGPLGVGVWWQSSRDAVAVEALTRGWPIVEICDPERVAAIKRGALWGAALRVCADAMRDGTEG